MCTDPDGNSLNYDRKQRYIIMMNKEEFIQLLQDKKYKTAQYYFCEMNDIDTAAFLEELDQRMCFGISLNL